MAIKNANVDAVIAAILAAASPPAVSADSLVVSVPADAVASFPASIIKGNFGDGYTDATIGIVDVDSAVIGIVTAPTGRY